VIESKTENDALPQEKLGGSHRAHGGSAKVLNSARSLRVAFQQTVVEWLPNLLRAAQLGDWRRSEFDVEDRVRHSDSLRSRWAIPFFERDFVCYRVTE
jgi:hypothetical protein